MQGMPVRLGFYDSDVTMTILNVELIPCDHLKTCLIHYGDKD